MKKLNKTSVTFWVVSVVTTLLISITGCNDVAPYDDPDQEQCELELIAYETDLTACESSEDNAWEYVNAIESAPSECEDKAERLANVESIAAGLYAEVISLRNELNMIEAERVNCVMELNEIDND